jgi:HEAT repeat protein
LEDAYYQADKDYRAGMFPLETATAIQCKAINSLGEIGNPAGVGLLVRVVGEARLEGAEKDQQQAMDKKIAAARALSSFKNYQATEALVRVLESEKDVAMRDCAHDSLKKITGKDLPPDYQAWNEMLHQSQGPGYAQDKNAVDRFLGWFGAGN